MAATSPHTPWPFVNERAALPPTPPSGATRWRDRLGDLFNQLYRYALARLLVRGLMKTRVAPSHVTAAQPLIAALAGYLMTFGDTRHLVIAALLFEARAILGCVDVTLARAQGASTREGHAERTAARGLSSAFLYAGIAWHMHLHAPSFAALGGYVVASAAGVAWIALAIALGGWLFARSPKLAAA